MINVSSVRADTVGCHDQIHLNNAGASLPPRQVVDAQVEYLRQEGRRGGYETHDAHAEQIGAVYQSVASLLGASADEIALTSNATESFQLAFGSIELGKGDRILTAEAEYSSNVLLYLHSAQRSGAAIEVIPSDEHGQTDPTALAEMIDTRVKLIAVSHMPTNGGLINPGSAIGAVARQAGIPYLLDACQTVGQLDLNVDDLGCDILTGTGRKYLRGPRGTGLLYVRRSFLDATSPPVIDNHGAHWVSPQSYELRDDARRYENFEFNFAAVLGLGVAVDYALGLGLADIEARVVELGSSTRLHLGSIPAVTVHDIGERQGGIVTFTHRSLPATEVVSRLGSERINTSYTTPASTLYDAERRDLDDMVRASVHYYNTTEEIDRFAAAVAAL